MGTRHRVFSFMSSFGSNRDSHTPSPTPAAQIKQESYKQDIPRHDGARDSHTPTGPSQHPYNISGDDSPQPRAPRERTPSRPMSMVQAYQPPLMDVTQDTLPELQPIFTFLNSHANKLYQEGYFLKLDDQNTQGKPNADRTWTECFAQLVGTILSLWDAAELDAAGQDGEVLPKFINLTDASIKMIESLPTRSDTEAPLQNVLSISTAGKNRYLLHFNSHHSLIQWTAGIRLAMFEHSTLQEAYTGALIAGKGKGLNNINIIMERAKTPIADWARVRFGAGTPWRRCWCVISPPDEKEIAKLQKLLKKKSAYDRSRPPILKGDIKFYDTRKTKKTRPIATITDAYSAFALYPQSKPLIDASTLVKVEGSITIHSNPPSTTEGFVFVMPEVHPAVTGFEMMLRWLFPVFDTFGLYGRPGRLVADTLDVRSLMFAMPKHRRYGYLEILDVSGLILEPGSSSWKESEWRKRMKELTGKRMTAIENGSRTNSRYSSRRSTRNSFGPSRSRVQFDDSASIKSSPSISWGQNQVFEGAPGGIPRTDSAPAGSGFSPFKLPALSHQRSASETHDVDRFQPQNPSSYDGAYEEPPLPPPHTVGMVSGGSGLRNMHDAGATPDRVSSEDEHAARSTPVRELEELQTTTSPEPVSTPPAFSHAPGSKPTSRPYHSPELRKANNRMSNATLSQLAGAGGVSAAAVQAGSEEFINEDQRRHNIGQYSEDSRQGVLSDVNTNEYPANRNGVNEGLVTTTNPRFSFEHVSPPHPANIAEEPAFPEPPAHQFPLNSPYQPSTNSFHKDDHLFRESPPSNRTYQPQQTAYSQSTTAAPLAYHNPQLSTGSTSSTGSQPSRLQTRDSIIRKPLPTRSTSIQTPLSAQTESSTASLERHLLDQAAFDLVGPDHRKHTPGPERQIQRQNSDLGSVYDDAASTDSPDYASTVRPSMESKRSAEKPRAGVMRTVGNTDSHGSAHSLSPSINIDFGPTYNYASSRLPLRSQSPSPSQGHGQTASPGPAMNNYPLDRPNKRPESSGHSRSPNRPVVAPDATHYRMGSADSRTLPWQPAMSTIAGSPSLNQQAITPEQFVQQRAAVANNPIYAHQRQSSSNILRDNTPTPPLGVPGNRSSEYLGQMGHSRNTSAELLQRPGSRGAAAALGPSGTGDITSTLSAREQEHVARITGQPLINMTQNSNKQAPAAGLVGAIGKREREKQQMKQGINSTAVQNAIAQRQQQALYQQYPAEIATNYRQSQYGNMGQYPQQFPIQGQSQETWNSPAANVYAQGGGFSVSSPGYVAPPPGYAMPSPGYAIPMTEQREQSPSLQYPPQQQYFPPQGQGQGRGNTGFHGHGF